MNFTYDDKTDTRECVAYIDQDGDLILKRADGDCVWVSAGGNVHVHDFKFDPDAFSTHKFYRGDTVTITF